MNKPNPQMPQRSPEGLASLDIFYRSFNDCNFYVEDIEQENLYFEIFRKLFPNARFERIFPLGGKNNVLRHAEDIANTVIQKRVYFLDRDFDNLLGQQANTRGVFYLGRFCIENYLIEESAIIEVVVETFPKLKRADIELNLDFQIVSTQIFEELREIFAFFYFVQFENLGIPNCKLKPEEFCVQRSLWKVCPKKKAVYVEKMRSACLKVGSESLAQPWSQDHRLAQFLEQDLHSVVSGKFHLVMIFHYLKKKYGLGTITFESFAYRVAKGCAFSDMMPLVQSVSDYLLDHPTADAM